MIVWEHWLGNTMQIFNREVQVNNFYLQISINFPEQNSTFERSFLTVFPYYGRISTVFRSKVCRIPENQSVSELEIRIHTSLIRCLI
jgi:hypothetical protein